VTTEHREQQRLNPAGGYVDHDGEAIIARRREARR
jgi:hypothetical protein